ncbi:MAG: hypothetical protein RJB37_3157 [Pseudomonadota bacterium]
MARPLLQQPLHAGWRFRAADARLGDTEQFTAPDGWHAATVPGTVYQDLIDSGALPDPLVGRQETAVQWVAERDWCYRLDFDLAADALRDQVALVFEGLDTFARVWLDGQPLAESDNMFVPLRVDITARLPHAGPSRHTLWIRFDSALRRGRALEAHHGARPLWNGDPSRLYVRKAPYHYGWDWGPTLLTCGPWKAVRLESADLRIAELASPVTLGDDLAHARVDLHTRLDGDLLGSIALEHTLRDPAGTLVATHRSPATAQHTASLSVDTPQLWWPAGHGAQPLYWSTRSSAASACAGCGWCRRRWRANRGAASCSRSTASRSSAAARTGFPTTTCSTASPRRVTGSACSRRWTHTS